MSKVSRMAQCKELYQQLVPTGMPRKEVVAEFVAITGAKPSSANVYFSVFKKEAAGGATPAPAPAAPVPAPLDSTVVGMAHDDLTAVAGETHNELVETPEDHIAHEELVHATVEEEVEEEEEEDDFPEVDDDYDGDDDTFDAEAELALMMGI